MSTVTNRTAVPADAAAGFEEQSGASAGRHSADVNGLPGARLPRPQAEGGVHVAVRDFASEDASSVWTRSASFRAAHHSPSPDTAGGGESFETVIAVGA